MAHREDNVGGTWRINTYPGLACDVKSRSARWEGDTQRWCLTTSTGEQHHFNIVVSAVGLFTQPVLPDLVEEEPFAGTVMHSSRWDHSVRLEGARVAGNVQLPQIVGGATPREVWRDGAHAYFGLGVPGFPNFFMLYGPNTNAGSNGVIFMLEAQARYIVRALKYMRPTGRTYVAVRPTALAEFVTKIDRLMTGTVWTTQCSNYFRAANGRVVTQWPRSARSFWEMTRRFKAADFSFSNAPAKAMAAVESGR